MAAAAIIPIVSALAPFIPSIVRGVEGLFGKGSGAQKMDAVTAAALSLVVSLQKSGVIKDTPTLETVQTMIESVVQGLKQGGELGGITAPVGTPAATAGTSTTTTSSTPLTLTFRVVPN